ncbi:MAG TPA: hypothetical protein VNH18_11655 [Bryobacteraceae bacterium]|nr:hypothetical protein [Bryobacteraceae bacterium]
MILRSFDTRVRVALLCAATLLPSGLRAADEQAPATPPAQSAPAQSAPPQEDQPAPARPQRPPALPKGQKPAIPDYPDARTPTFGIYGFGTVPGNGPDVAGGKAKAGPGVVNGLGKEHIGPGIYVAMPVSRTTEIRFEGFETKGAGNQTLTADQFIFGTQFYNKDYLANSYRILTGKLWVDDLFWPHKFPVAKFRLKAIYGVRYLSVKGTVDAPLGTVSGSTVVGYTGTGSKQVVMPALGLAPEYAISKHVLFRVEGSGFGLPHKAMLWDSEATLSYRKGKIEIFGGAKAVGFKTSPKADFYYNGQVYGGVFGVKYHWQ